MSVPGNWATRYLLRDEVWDLGMSRGVVGECGPIRPHL